MNAIREISKQLKIDTSQIAAFGDDYNDLDMISCCGVGIAMGNAVDKVKAAANYICGTNDNDGVAKWINSSLQFEWKN